MQGSLGNLFSPALGEALGVWVAALLTLIVYSYLLSDNPLYRLAQHLFVGSAVAYAVVTAYHQVLVGRLFSPLLTDPQANWPLVIPALLGLLLLLKSSPTISWLGNTTVGFLLGVGAALGIGGALAGSILPQLKATILSFSIAGLGGGLTGLERAFDNLILVVGTTGTLLYFYFSRGGEGPVARVGYGLLRLWGGLGRWIIMITFGAIYANTVMSRVSLLLGRVQFLLGDWLQIIGR
ncbi:MAG: hypothetical protein ACE5NP_10410 [Anaerolineae bacterium]